jgi:GNAT superfamily N-acetyltransferase
MQKMKIQFIHIVSPDYIESSELRKRAVESSKSHKTIHYLVLADGVEVAFVSLDRWPESHISQMVLYEIYVPRAMRGNGIATAVLDEVEKIAIKEGFKKMHLRPSSLDNETSQTKLIEWYRRKGYDWDQVSTADMEKSIQNRNM